MKYVGIDSGVNTGIAVWCDTKKQFDKIETIMIHRAMAFLIDLASQGLIYVRVEDARQVKYNTSPEKAQGAGSVKRDAKIWEDFLKDYNIAFEMVRPRKAITKLDSKTFKNMTKWDNPTNSHGRDAAMLVFNFKTFRK